MKKWDMFAFFSKNRDSEALGFHITKHAANISDYNFIFELWFHSLFNLSWFFFVKFSFLHSKGMFMLLFHDHFQLIFCFFFLFTVWSFTLFYLFLSLFFWQTQRLWLLLRLLSGLFLSLQTIFDKFLSPLFSFLISDIISYLLSFLDYSHFDICDIIWIYWNKIQWTCFFVYKSKNRKEKVFFRSNITNLKEKWRCFEFCVFLNVF